jgi:hypothetical protein
MDADTDRDDRPWRPAAAGASWVYVFPRPGEDLLKLGMSRDPLERLQTLHPRWYEFFDLDAGWIAATDRVREARAVELRLAHSLAGLGAPAPLTVNAAAGGQTEWYRGALTLLDREGKGLESEGIRVYRPLRQWLLPRMREQAARLFHWSEALLSELESAGPQTAPRPEPLEWTLCHGLDALPALDLPLAQWVSPRVLAWREAVRRRTGV